MIGVVEANPKLVVTGFPRRRSGSLRIPKMDVEMMSSTLIGNAEIHILQGRHGGDLPPESGTPVMG